MAAPRLGAAGRPRMEPHAAGERSGRGPGAPGRKRRQELDQQHREERDDELDREQHGADDHEDEGGQRSSATGHGPAAVRSPPQTHVRPHAACHGSIGPRWGAVHSMAIAAGTAKAPMIVGSSRGAPRSMAW